MIFHHFTQVSIITDNSYPYRPRLREWVKILNHLNKESYQLRINFLSNPYVVAKSKVILDLFPSSNIVASYTMNCIKWIIYSFRNIVKINALSRRNKFNVWIRYFPLLAKHPKIIHLWNSYLYPWYYSYIKLAKCLTIVSFHGGDIIIRPYNDKQWRETINNIFYHCDYLHFCSYYLKEEALRLGAPKEKSIVIYPGVDLTFFKPSTSLKGGIKNDKITLITVSRVEWEKGLVNALKAVKLLLSSGFNIQYLIVGFGQAKDELTYWIRELNIDTHVTLLGYQSPETIKILLGKSDIYIQPSIYEAFGVSIIEASSMELPIIASNIGGIPEAVIDDITGILIPPDDINALADAIVTLIKDKNKRTEMGKQGRKMVERKFSILHEVKEWLRYYQQL